MCTRKFLHVRGVSVYAKDNGWLPCGMCEECRSVHQNSWGFRLRAEMESLVKRGWWLGFLTLTFDDYHLPHIPQVLIADGVDYSVTPPCFSKPLARKFLTDLRQWLKRKFDAVKRIDKETGELLKDDAIRFMLCSEYGEATHRPHHHFLLALPPSVDSRKVFEYVHERWTYGHVFPKCYDGGTDRHQYEHKPFVVKNPAEACHYLVKYVAKDLSYFDSIKKTDFKDCVEIEETPFCNAATVRLSDYMPFHMQSKSLGLSFIDNLSDTDKVKYINYGVSFVGADHNLRLPVYLYKKLVFDNYYIIDADGKRLCRVKANQFFKEHYREIYAKKVDALIVKIDEFKALDKNRLVAHCSDYVAIDERIGTLPLRSLAQDYLSFGGVAWHSCRDIDRADFWLAKYRAFDHGDYVEEVDMSQSPCIPYEYWEDLHRWFNTNYYIQNTLDLPLEKLRVEQRRRLDFYRDLYKSIED